MPIRVLILEDKAADAELMLHELRRAGLDPDGQVVGIEPDYLTALGTYPDLILADWSLPQFSGLRALQMMNERGLDIPFIIVSGDIGEEAAVDAMRLGAADYLLKDRLTRLGQAVRRALEDKQLREERKRTEEYLRLSEEKYRTLVNEVNDGFYIVDEAGVFTFANPALARMYGVENPQALVGRKFMDFIVPEMIAGLSRAQQSSMHTGLAPETIDGQIVRPDGSRAFLEIKPVSIIKGDRVVGSHGVVRDVTERKRSEAALQASEAEFRILFNNSLTGISQTLPNGQIIRANTAYAQLYGYANPEEMMAEVSHIHRFYANPEDREEVLRILADRGVMEPREMTVVRRDGTRIVVLVSAREIRDSEGNLRCYQAEHIDITKRKQAEVELMESKAIVDAVVENIPLMLFLKEATDLRFVLFNRAGEELLGYDRASLLGKNNLDLFPPEQAAHFMAKDREVLDGEAGILDIPEEPIQTAKKGQRLLHTRKVCIRGADGTTKYLLGISEDITERKKAEERIQRQLRHLTAMSSIDRVIAQNYELKLSLSEILSQATMELGVDAADILILNPTLQILEFAAERGFRTTAIRKAQVPLVESLAGRAVQERQLVHFRNPGNQPDSAFCTAHLTGEDFVSYYGIPLIAKEQVRGVLEVMHRTALQPDAEWFDFLNALAGQTAIAVENSTLFKSQQRTNLDLSLAYDATIEGWSRAIDLRDKETEGHSQRVTEMTMNLARAFGLSEADMVQVRWGSLLHDIGKLGVPDGILLKPGPLTDEEWAVMKRHPTFAYEMLSPIGYLRMALEIPYCHHEKWDGTGYPRGLKGAQIPLKARIFAVVDAWDALKSDRPYRPGWTEEKACEHLRVSSGTHFDPQVVDAFMQIPHSV